MRCTLAVLAVISVGLAQAAVEPESIRYADKEMLLKQKFLFEIVHRVEDPLGFEQWIQHGKSLIVDKEHYEKFNPSMKKFYEGFRLGHLLPKGEFFGIMMPLHAEQAIGLFYYFYYAKDWATFQQNVCWARMHVNEGMFVYALNMAVIHRHDFEGLMMPTIYEIFPQHFFNSRFIYQAEKFNYDVWSRNAMYEKEQSDSYLREHKDVHGRQKHLVDWKTWQWWKLMGIEPRWHKEEKHLVRDNIKSMAKDPKWVEAMRGVEAFWMPVDYTRDINMLNEDSVLSFSLEDVDYDSLWYYLNLDYSFLVNQHEFGIDKDRASEYFLHVLRYFYAQYNLQRLSHGLGPIEEINQFKTVETGYNPQMISWNGVPFVPRANNWNVASLENKKSVSTARMIRDRIIKTVHSGKLSLLNGTFIDMWSDENIDYFGKMLHSTVDMDNFKYFGSYFNYIILALTDEDPNNFADINPQILLNFETMLRDPLTFMLFKYLYIEILERYQRYRNPYTRDELLVEGVNITDVYVSELMTYFDYTDIDVSNLLNDNMHFVDGQYQWNRALFGRQTRLNHKPFYFNLTIESTRPQRVAFRTFIAPKLDHEGSVIPLKENRMNFIELDEFTWDLAAGTNVIHRPMSKHYLHGCDRTSYTELYRLVLLALEDKYDFPLHLNPPHSAYPLRMYIPKGWPEGLPVQFFVAINPTKEDYEPYVNFDESVSSGIGSGQRYVDDRPLLYPLDRHIDESQFFVPNFYFKDVKIYHMDVLEKYDQGYENYGHFDYDYLSF